MNVNGWGISLAAMEAAAGSIVAARLIVQDHVQTRSWLITTAAAWKFIAWALTSMVTSLIANDPRHNQSVDVSYFAQTPDG